MACMQNLISGFDMLKVMSNHFVEDDFEALQASVMGFAYEIAQINKNCDINFSIGQNSGKAFNAHTCLEQTKSFYNLFKPVMNQPQEILNDIKAFKATLEQVGTLLSSCGVGLNDSQNKEIEEMIESKGDVDISSLHSIKNKYGVKDQNKTSTGTENHGPKAQKNPHHRKYYQFGKFETNSI